MVDISVDEFPYAAKCVLERFHINKVREIIAGCHFKFLKREIYFSFTANGLRNIRNFSVLPDHMY